MNLHIFFISLIIYTVWCLKTPCPEGLTVNITNGLRNGNVITHDGVNYDERNYYEKNDTIYGCICNIRKPCLRKCCGLSEEVVNRKCEERKNGSVTVPTHNGANKTDSLLKHHIFHNNNCGGGLKMTLEPHLYDSDLFYVQENGSIYLPNFDNNQMRNPEHYCFDSFTEEERAMNRTFTVNICVFNEDIDIEDTAARSMKKHGMIISMPFLLLTFLAYALLPDRNLHMKALMIYVINLMMGYLLLVIIQLTDSKFSQTSCILTGIFCLFFFMVSFFWMNIICIDIWLTFSGLRGFSGSKKKAEQKRFYIYCGYGLGVPFLLVLTVYLIDVYAAISPTFKPGIGYGKCFLQEGYPELLYFYGPIAFLITTNIVLFIITAFKIRSIKKDTSMLKKADSKRHSYENDKQTFNLYVKLLFAMGINWSMEIISWLVLWQAAGAPQYLWYLTDFCNALYGVFIFFIFVFKRSTWKLLKKRYYSFIGKPHLAHSLTITNTTRVTSYSTANSSIHGDPHGGATDTSTLTSGV